MLVHPVRSLGPYQRVALRSRILTPASRLPASCKKPDVSHRHSSFAPLAVKATNRNTISASSKFAISPTARYEQLAKQGTLRTDPHQKSIIQILQSLHDDLISCAQVPIVDPPSSTFFGRFFSKRDTLPSITEAPKSLYLYGDVGTGKSMLMDLFYDTLPPNVSRKRRVHFHAFMIDIHKALHRQAARGIPVEDALAPIARELAKEVEVLCFDEFQVTDIVDAMILRRLLEELLDCGVIMVMTSNRHPDDLYKNGIQRESFIPAIELIKHRFVVTDLNSGTDYRKMPRALSKVYYSPITPENRLEFDKLFDAMTASDIELDRRLKVWGRDLLIPASGNGVARFTFEELCGNALSAADYLEVTKEFGAVFVEDIPLMNLNSKDKARRFITFIDACYESKTKLFTLSEVPVCEVFSDAKLGSEVTDEMRSIMDDLGLSTGVVSSSSIFTGEEEIFAFARACSRLVEMGTIQWAEASAA